MGGLSLGDGMATGPSGVSMMDTTNVSGSIQGAYGGPMVTPPMGGSGPGMYPGSSGMAPNPVPVAVTVVPQPAVGVDGAPPVPDVVTIPPASGAPSGYMGAPPPPGVFSGGLGTPVQPVVQSPIDLDDLGLTPELMASLAGGDGESIGDGMDDAMWQTLMESADSLGTAGLVSPLIKSEPPDEQ